MKFLTNRNTLQVVLRGVVLLVFLCGYRATGQVRILSFDRNGEIAWSGTDPSVYSFLQWAPTIAGPWGSLFDGQPLILSSAASRITVPLTREAGFFRIRNSKFTALADALTESSTIGLSPLAARFDPPPGDGRHDGAGLWIAADSSFEVVGSIWEMEYSGNDPGVGVQIIHPYQNGQCIVSIHRDSVGLDTPERWVSVGYHHGDASALTRAPAFASLFPLQSGTMYRFKTEVRSSGRVSVFVDDTLVATGFVTRVHPVDFMVGEADRFHASSSWNFLPFRGPGFPVRWSKGHAGVIVEPTQGDTGRTGVYRVRYSPGL